MSYRWLLFASVVLAAVLTVPSLLDALDRSAALAGTKPLFGGAPRSGDGSRRRAQKSLGARRFSDAAAEARAVLLHAPLDTAALQTLSSAEDALGDSDAADELAIGASFASWRMPYVQLRMFNLTLTAGDLNDAARRADAVSRRVGFTDEGFQALNLLLLLPDGVSAVAARLAFRPPWRLPYLTQLASGADGASRYIVPLLVKLTRTDGPPSRSEIARVLQLMVKAGRGWQAWEYWEASKPRSVQDVIDDPDMQAAIVNQTGEFTSPFVWSLPSDTLVRLVDRRDEQGQPALRVESPSDRSELFVSRLTFVPAGVYHFAYSAWGSPSDLDRLHPDFGCTSGAQVKPESSLRVVTGGRSTFALDVRIPVGCGLLRLGFTLDSGESATPTEISIRRVVFSKFI